MTHEASSIEQVDKLLRLLHKSVDTLMDLGHSDSPHSTCNPPGVPMPDCQLIVCYVSRLLT